MAISKAKKEEIVSDLQDRLSRSRVAILTDFKGLDVSAITELRNELRKADSEFKVAKNSLMKLATAKVQMEGLEKHIEGPRAIAFNYEDPVAPAKVLVDFSKKNDKLEIIAGTLDAKVISKDDIQNLAKLPSREELLAQLLSAMNAVPAGLVQVLAAIPRQLVNVLTAIRDQKEE